jgi:hypothetical protein
LSSGVLEQLITQAIGEINNDPATLAFHFATSQ